MKNVLQILTFILVVMSFLVARGTSTNIKSNVSMKVNKYYFDVNYDEDTLYKKRSWKRRKIKRKPRRGRDNR
ncbi:MAG: hypothetical protein CMF82_01330 [Candidatus Marinimicrobia bacterium]|nr:hypothetical protein [Candidatus Neomarinimicrobiota bacterium]|tara:strand:- start:1308 stop:1523 length:216 start_codon:yes stop_codon:yes gene_type:complete